MLKRPRWIRCNTTEANLIHFGWAWWDIPALLMPRYYATMALAPLYRRYGTIRTDIA